MVDAVSSSLVFKDDRERLNAANILNALGGCTGVGLGSGDGEDEEGEE